MSFQAFILDESLATLITSKDALIRQFRSKHLNSRVRTLASVDLPVSLQHLNSQKSVTTEVTRERFLAAMLPNRMWSQMISTGKPLVTGLNIESLSFEWWRVRKRTLHWKGSNPWWTFASWRLFLVCCLNPFVEMIIHWITASEFFVWIKDNLITT